GLVCGLDLSSGMLREARKEVRRHAPRVEVSLIQSDALRLPFESHIFDGVFTSFTLEIFPEEDLDVLLWEIHRILRPGGRLGVVAISEGKPGKASGAMVRAYAWFHRHFPHIVDCRPVDLEGVLQRCRFRVLRSIELEMWSI